MSSELSSRSKRIIQSSLRDILGANDFRKLGRKYFRSVGDINGLVIAPGDRWSSSSITTLTIAVGIHVPGVIAVWTNAREPLNPGIEDCCISAHIEHLASQPKSGVWDLRTTDDAPARDA